MKKLILYILILCITSCNHKANKNTFIFDFDYTLHHSKTSYPHLLAISIFGEKNANRKLNEIQTLMKKLKKDGFSDVIILQKIVKKYKIIPAEKDINFVIKELLKSQTKGLKEIILNLKSKGHKVLIIGGGTWECAIIPEFAKDLGIEKNDIYSGYFNGTSKKEIVKVLSDEYRYTNCGNLDLQTPVSDRKSDVIKYLKQNNIIDGKIIHIGDGGNDLEVWKSGEVDAFIGFGVNTVVTKVQQEAPIFVKNIEEFKSVVFKYA